AGVWIGQRLEQDRIDCAEDRDGRADSQGQRQNTDRRKAWTAPQSTTRITQIGERRPDRVLPAVRAHLLAYECRAADFTLRRSPRILGRKALCEHRRGRLFEVVPYLVVDILVCCGSIRENAQATRELPPDSHPAPCSQDDDPEPSVDRTILLLHMIVKM